VLVPTGGSSPLEVCAIAGIGSGGATRAASSALRELRSVVRDLLRGAGSLEASSREVLALPPPRGLP
jgi:hypothetical protein